MHVNRDLKFDFSLWIRNNYLFLIIIFLILYVLFAFLAPIMMKAGFPIISEKIYLFYSNLCHQYAHRSWFLFGKQSYYPLESKTNIVSAIKVFNVDNSNVYSARKIIGNEIAGYKVAICQRDVALYGALILFALIFLLKKKHIKKISFSLWLLLAVIPMGIDGTWQLVSSIELLKILQLSHESTPFLRTITGCMFGFFSGWLLFPAIEESIKDDK